MSGDYRCEQNNIPKMYLVLMSYSGDDKIDKGVRNILFNLTKVIGAAYTTKQVVLDNWEALNSYKLTKADHAIANT